MIEAGKQGVANWLAQKMGGQQSWPPYQVRVRGEANTHLAEGNGSSSQKADYFLILTVSIPP